MNFDLNKAIELRQKGMSYNNIAKELHSSKQTISYYLKENGYGPNEKYIRNKQKQPNKKHLNEDYFENINTEHKAYWLGFMLADGCVNKTCDRIELCLKENDYNHIAKFKEDIESEHEIGQKKKFIDDKVFISYRLAVTSKKMKADLISHNCTPNKTKILTFPDIDEDMIPHLIRGYIDGDGCITSHTTSKISLEILGTYEFLSSIRKFFGLSENKYIYGFNHSDIKRLVITGKKAFEIIDSLYSNSDIYLNRKYDKYKEFAALFSDKQSSEGKIGSDSTND